jgi:hypothetical protein
MSRMNSEIQVLFCMGWAPSSTSVGPVGTEQSR